MKNKVLAVLLMSSGMVLSGCDYFKNRKETTEEVATTWSCTHPENISNLQKQLNQQYLKQVERDLRESKYYEADQQLLRTISQNLKFDITDIRTITTETKDATKLSCEAQLVVTLPKGLQQRATNAFAEHNQDCEECEDNQTLQDHLEAGDASVRLLENKLLGQLKYELTKTEQKTNRMLVVH
jgi:vacuolar-type H+-ATPase subunit I/STV1